MDSRLAKGLVQDSSRDLTGEEDLGDGERNTSERSSRTGALKTMV
jgi:hypothetical protein